jgi:capsular polysaccharide biosynthesis protein
MQPSHTRSEFRGRERPEPLQDGEEFVFERTGEDSAHNGHSRHSRVEAPAAPPPPRSVSLGTALRRYPVLALLPVVILAAAGITLGLRRHPTYTASTVINVGAPDINSQATPGYVQAEQALASAYSREVTSQFVYTPVADKLNISQAEVASRLSSSAVPDSPTFTINATGTSAQSAITLAATATRELRHYINVVNQGEQSSTQLLKRYRDAEREADRLSAISGRLDGQNRVLPGSVSSARRQEAKLAAQVAQLQANALSAQYTNGSTMSRGAIIQVLQPATSASSDRRSITERYGIIGAAAGLVLGAALALLVANLRRRRWAADAPA